MDFIDEDQDVVVIGTGLAGMVAAIQSRLSGCRVTVLEKASDVTKNSTAFAGGGFAIKTQPYGPYTKEELYKKYLESSKGKCKLELVKAVVENSADDFRWLVEELGLPVSKKNPCMVEGKGAAIGPHLLEVATKLGARILFNTRAVKLLTDDGRISGVKAYTSQGIKGVLKDYRATAVILATGGFEADGEMVRKYCGEDICNTAYRRIASSLDHTGDGIKMALEVGAAFLKHPPYIHTRTEDKSWLPGRRYYSKISGYAHGPLRSLPNIHRYAIWVNKKGRRFIDETEEADIIATAITRQPEGEVGIIFDHQIREMFPEEFNAYQEFMRKEINEDVILTVDDLEQAARIIGCPSEALQNTVREYNEAKSGRAKELKPPKGEHEEIYKPIDMPPYYVVHPVWSGLNTIWGGLEINEKAQVLDQQDKLIPGLYAAGAIFGGVFFGEWIKLDEETWTYKGNYHWVSNSFPVSLVFARIAGRNAAEEKKRASQRIDETFG